MDDNANDKPFEMTSQEPTDIGDNTPIIADSALATASPAQGPRTDRALWLTVGGITVAACCVVFVLVFNFLRSDPFKQFAESFPTQRPTATLRPGALTATQHAADFPVSAVNAEATASSAMVQWNLFLTESFTDNKSRWYTGQKADEYASINRTISDGKYIWDATAKQGFVWWAIPPRKYPLQDFFASVEAQASGAEGNEYGLIFRKDGAGNYYFFQVKDIGLYSLSLRHNERWTTIIPWSASPHIKKGEANRIAVMGQGPQFLFLINDEFVARAYDESITTGYVTFGISVNEKDERVVFEFDNFEIRSPNEAATGPESLTATQRAWVKPVIPPTLGGAENALQAFQDKALDNLRQRAVSIPDLPDVSQPGDVFVYDVRVDQSESLLWSYGWCASTAEILAENLSNMKVEFTINGVRVLDNLIAIKDHPRASDEGGECRTFIALIAKWPGGNHQLEVNVTFLAPINDGWNNYPAGTHTFKYLVYAP